MDTQSAKLQPESTEKSGVEHRIKLQSLRRVEMESTCSIDRGTENEVRALALGLEACVFDEGGGENR